MVVERSPSLDLLLLHGGRSVDPADVQALLDGFQDGSVRAAEAFPQALLQADARPWAMSAWDAWDDVRQDARADGLPAFAAADAEK